MLSNNQVYDIRAAIGEKLKAFRKSKNLSQEKFSEEVGLSQHRYSQIEQGKSDFRISSILKIISAFNELSYLIPISESIIRGARDCDDTEERGNGSN